MASEDEAPPMESILASEEIRNEMHEVDGNMKRAETPQIKETPLQAAQKSPPRNGIPPKRPLTAAKRSSTSTPSAATKATASSTSRNDPVDGLGKPPARPTPTSGTRRPATNVTAASAPRVGHKIKTLTDSVDDSMKSYASGSEENFKSSANSAATRSPARPALSSAASSTSRRPTLASATYADIKPALGKAGAGIPTKPALRTTTNNSRPTSTLGAPRSMRPAMSPVRNATGSDLAKKRLSTISASPASLPSGKPLSDQRSLPASKAAKQIRPGLVARKSTMSVTIEQRLREMELVHRMLTAAMVDDGVEDDEVKEEYGKTADDTLASLRAKLEEARRREGKEGLSETEGHADDNVDEEANNGDEVRSAVGHGQARSTLSESAQTVCHSCSRYQCYRSLLNSTLKVSNLEAELTTLKAQMLQYTEATDHVSKDVQEVTERMSKEQASKIDGLISAHHEELAVFRAKLNEAESRHKEQLESSLEDVEEARRIAEAEGSQKAAEALESQKQEHARNFKLLEGKFADEKRKGVDAASRFEQIEAEVSSLKHLLHEEQQRSDRLAQDVRTQQENAVKELNEALNIKDKEISNLENEIEDLQATHNRELDELEASASAKESLLEAEVDSLRNKMRELKTVIDSTSSSHGKVLQAKDREIMHQSQVIEDLQNKLQQLNEVKEREIEEVKTNLISEHEQNMSKVRREHETTLSTLRDATREKAEEITLRHQRDKQSLEKEHQITQDNLDKKLLEMASLNADLESSMEATRSATIRESKDYQGKLEESHKALEEMQLAQRKADEALKSLKAKILSLELERDQAKAEKLSVEKALEAASHEVTSMKKILKTLENASSDSDKQHVTAVQRMKDELDVTSRSLEDKIKEYSTASEAHVQESKSVRASHSKEIKGLEKKNREALRTLQKTHDDLLAKYEKAEKEHSSVISALKAEHADAIDKQAKAFESFKTAQAEELTKNESQIPDFDDLQKQHDKEVTSLQKEVKDSLAAKKTHQTALADLRMQYEKQSDLLAHTEQLLQEVRALASQEDSEKTREASKETEELRRLLTDAQAKATQDKEAIDKLTAEVKEASGVSLNVAEAEGLREKMSELTEQHAAEISKLQETSRLGIGKREEEKKHEAEIKDRLSNELEKLEAGMTATKKDMEKQQRKIDAQTQKAEEVGQQLTAARTSEERLQTDLRKALGDLEAYRAETESAKPSVVEASATETAVTSQMLETLQAAAKAERERNAISKERLSQAEIGAEKHATQIRELESALKVTTAELVEMRTKRPGGSEYSGSPAPEPVLRSSLWPVPDYGYSGENKPAMVGEELGSSIVGRVGCPFTSTS